MHQPDVVELPHMRDLISEKIFAPTLQTALLKPELGDSAGVFGAAMLTAGLKR